MANAKMTYVMALENAIKVVNGETKDKLVALKGTLEKKAQAKKETKAQVENKGIKASLMEFLAENPKSTIKSILANETFAEYSNQKISALLSQLAKDGTVLKEYDKKTPIFSVIETE